MFWKDLQGKADGVFKRLTGVRRPTFEKMVAVAREQTTLRRKHPTRGRPQKTALEDQLLMLLMYYREYRTFLHTATTYGYSEAQGWRIVRRLEDILIKSGVFALPGKRALLTLDGVDMGSVVIVDVSESVVERPKKSSAATTPAKSTATP
jgi:Helix-turn-helix of DDE superfamily endonuclease